MATSPYISFFAAQYQQYFNPTLQVPPNLDSATDSFIGADNLLLEPVVYSGGVYTGNTNGGVILTGGVTSLTVPNDPTIAAVNDVNTNDTVNGGADNLTVFLQFNTTFNTDTGTDKILSVGADTINAGSGATTVQGSASGTTVNGGSGGLSFFGGNGPVSVVGGSGNNIAFGSQGNSPTYLQAGSGNDTLVGGFGGGATKLVGGNNTYELAAGNGPTTMIAGKGVTLINGQTGTGIELAITSTGYDSIALNNANDTVVGGSGTSVVLGGAGNDVYGFLDGHAGGSETIYNLNTATDTLVFGGYSGSPIAAEAIGAGGDVLQLTDGTTITLAGVDHTLFT